MARARRGRSTAKIDPESDADESECELGRVVDTPEYAEWADGMADRACSHERDPRSVCHHCFQDAGLRRYVRHAANARVCDFCGRRFRKDRAAPLETVARFVEGCLRRNYDHPENVLFYDRESESGWAGNVWSNSELIEETVAADWPVMEAIIACFNPDFEWCEADPALFMPEEHLRVSWEIFCDYVKHRSRFMFLRPDESGRRFSDEQDDTLVRSTEMLDLFGEAIEACNLIHTLGARTRLYRVRSVSDSGWFTTPEDLGPPPSSPTGPPASRMSPAGIPLLYVALDEKTALEETMSGSGRASMAAFSPMRALRLLDLRGDRPVPYRSIFEKASSVERGMPQFVRAFRNEIARPVARDGREHIEYVPSQIVTEFIRRVYRTSAGERLDGVLYPSTKNPEGVCAALFVTAGEIKDSGARYGREPLLRFRPRSVRRLQVRFRSGRVSRWSVAS